MFYRWRGDFEMKISAVDLFCGVGGLTNGVIKSGIRVNAGIDIDETCRYAYEKNNIATFINKNIEEIHKEEIEALYPSKDIKLLMGCAPCQPFSSYSKHKNKKSGIKDQKWGLLYSFSKLIQEVKPEIVSMENVPYLSKEKVFIDFINILEKAGYHYTWKVIYCPDYGIPQNRKRLLLLASLYGEIEFLPPVYNADNYITVRDTIYKLPKIKAGEICESDPLHRASSLSPLNIKRIQQSKPGGSWLDWDPELLSPCHLRSTGTSYKSVYGRMEWDKPSPTITTQFYGFGNGRFGHPEQDRALSIREGALLQTFPLNYDFIDPSIPFSITSIGKHIGNAVPVKLGEIIAKSILKHLEGVKNE